MKSIAEAKSRAWGEIPSSYRPICFIDKLGKIFQRIIVNRIQEHLDSIEKLSNL